MSARYTKTIPEFIYFIDNGEWKQGPYVTKKTSSSVRKFKLVEVIDKKTKKNE